MTQIAAQFIRVSQRITKEPLSACPPSLCWAVIVENVGRKSSPKFFIWYHQSSINWLQPPAVWCRVQRFTSCHVWPSLHVLHKLDPSNILNNSFKASSRKAVLTILTGYQSFDSASIRVRVISLNLALPSCTYGWGRMSLISAILVLWRNFYCWLVSASLMFVHCYFQLAPLHF